MYIHKLLGYSHYYNPLPLRCLSPPVVFQGRIFRVVECESRFKNSYRLDVLFQLSGDATATVWTLGIYSIRQENRPTSSGEAQEFYKEWIEGWECSLPK